jgi:hypothetical protein
MWSVEGRVGARVQAGEGPESRLKWDSSECLGASEGVGPPDASTSTLCGNDRPY